ncbi:response regulator [Anaeroselena agilis]|uniref:Response regulator n=1 Tax=Anaeroselena agilis TaxID=3063788 RepID=A0ABU3NV41_9FIRM|nr:response regulator [Selenomonadales bacterium 4137-cl]
MPRVLIVDDAEFIRFSLRLMLEKNGFEVVGAAKDGADGIMKYKELKPDIVTLDITMPGMDGITALKAITASDPDAKVVVVSAMGREDIIKDAVMCGAKYFLVKPFKEEQVLETVRKVLAM